MGEISGFTRSDVQEILSVVDKLEDVEIQLETGDIKLFVKKGGATLLQAAPPASAPAQPQGHAAVASTPEPQPQLQPVSEPVATTVTNDVPAGMLAIRAPMLGRFFVAPSPNDPPFVQLGQKVGQDDSVAVLEVMKLFSTIQAGVAGTVVEVRAENGEMVEFDQILFVVKPD